MTYFVQRQFQKFRNVQTEYNGRIYRSKFEASYAQELDLRIKAGELLSWEYERKFEFNLVPNRTGKYVLSMQPQVGYDGERLHGAIHLTNYLIDFTLYRTDGVREFVETKGFETPEWKLKWKLFEAALSSEHPSDVLTLVKQQGFYRNDMKGWKQPRLRKYS